MIVSWNWLKQYVTLDMPLAELEQRLMMAGLNHEGDRRDRGDDLAIDLEVTSNRPDCLGHIGVAREVAVLWDTDLHSRPPSPPKDAGHEVTSVTDHCPELCHRYTARVIKGVKVGPSPDWLLRRLETIFRPRDTETSKWRPVNNVVDITNYVLMECGQPLHAFDFDKLRGQRDRRPRGARLTKPSRPSITRRTTFRRACA